MAAMQFKLHVCISDGYSQIREMDFILPISMEI